MKILQNSWTSTEKRDKMLALPRHHIATQTIAYLAEKDTIRIWGQTSKTGHSKGYTQ
jgi:hypothetical protein